MYSAEEMYERSRVGGHRSVRAGRGGGLEVFKNTTRIGMGAHTFTPPTQGVGLGRCTLGESTRPLPKGQNTVVGI
jgi:hypothetical protein